jgi:hypothetical protein
MVTFRAVKFSVKCSVITSVKNYFAKPTFSATDTPFNPNYLMQYCAKPTRIYNPALSVIVEAISHLASLEV